MFYHTMDIPGVGIIEGLGGASWDLRASFQDMLGMVNFDGQRVLEIGPASGFLTFEMERRGATVVAIEVPDDHVYDIVPWPTSRGHWQSHQEGIWQACTNAWWFAHEHFKSTANICYSGAYELPRLNIGKFNTAILANILLHNRDPLKIIFDTAEKTANKIIIVEQFQYDLEPCGLPLACLTPNPNGNGGYDNSNDWNVWWRFSTTYLINYLKVLGFKKFDISRYPVPWNSIPIEEFTLVASR